MKTSVLALPFALCLLDAGPGVDGLGFHPAAGLSLTKTFETELFFELDGVSLTVNGEDFGAMLGEVAFEVESTSTFVVADEYIATQDGRPLELRRHFDEIGEDSDVSIEMALMSEGMDVSASSALEGATVLFVWNEDDEAYDVRFDGDDDEGRDQDLLDGLEVDMDLLGLLPDEELEEGDSWELGGEVLSTLFLPGGDLKLLPDDAGADELDLAGLEDYLEDLGQRVDAMLDEWLDGEARCTFSGTRDDGGTEVAVVQLQLDFTLDADVSDLMQEAVEQVLDTEQLPVEVDVSFDVVQVDATLTGEGELLWNLAGGHVHALRLASDFDLSVELEVSFEAQGESYEVEALIEASGTIENSLSVE